MTRTPLTFFVLDFARSIPIWVLEPGDWPITAAVVVPMLAALILVYREEGAGGVRRLLGRVFDYRRIRNKAWYVPIILLWPLLALLAYLVTRLIGLPVSAEWSNPLLAAPLLFALFFVLAIGEEPGWTGYATDPLLRRHSALATGLILGLVSSLWHLAPLINMGRSPAWIAWWVVWAVPLRILFVWIYNNTGKSLFAVVVFHAMLNLSTSSPFIPRNDSPWDPAIIGVITVISAVLVTIGWGWRTLTRSQLA
jgi:membrane protease YdiL (CAAX protease family)